MHLKGGYCCIGAVYCGKDISYLSFLSFTIAIYADDQKQLSLAPQCLCTLKEGAVSVSVQCGKDTSLRHSCTPWTFSQLTAVFVHLKLHKASQCCNLIFLPPIFSNAETATPWPTEGWARLEKHKR